MICIHCHQDEDAMVTYRVPLRGSVGFSLVVFEFFLTFFVLNDLTVGKALLLAVCRHHLIDQSWPSVKAWSFLSGEL